MYIYDFTMVISCVDRWDENDITRNNFICNGEISKEFWQNNDTLTA